MAARRRLGVHVDRRSGKVKGGPGGDQRSPLGGCCDPVESQHGPDSLISRAFREKPASTFS
jgi:hypothetical protein